MDEFKHSSPIEPLKREVTGEVERVSVKMGRLELESEGAQITKLLVDGRVPKCQRLVIEWDLEHPIPRLTMRELLI